MKGHPCALIFEFHEQGMMPTLLSSCVVHIQLHPKMYVYAIESFMATAHGPGPGQMVPFEIGTQAALIQRAPYCSRLNLRPVIKGWTPLCFWCNMVSPDLPVLIDVISNINAGKASAGQNSLCACYQSITHLGEPVASAAFLVWDALLCFKMEVAYIWL